MDKSILDLSAAHSEKAYELSTTRRLFVSAAVEWMLNNHNEDFESKFDDMRIDCFGRDFTDEIDDTHTSCGHLMLACKAQIKSLYEARVAWDLEV